MQTDETVKICWVGEEVLSEFLEEINLKVETLNLSSRIKYCMIKGFFHGDEELGFPVAELGFIQLTGRKLFERFGHCFNDIMSDYNHYFSVFCQEEKIPILDLTLNEIFTYLQQNYHSKDDVFLKITEEQVMAIQEKFKEEQRVTAQEAKDMAWWYD